MRVKLEDLLPTVSLQQHFLLLLVLLIEFWVSTLAPSLPNLEDNDASVPAPNMSCIRMITSWECPSRFVINSNPRKKYIYNTGFDVIHG